MAIWKKAAQRVFDQVEELGSNEYPCTFDDSQNSYDAGGDPNPFNASLSAVAYKIMIRLARKKGRLSLRISMSGLWRNYYNIVGYHRDSLTKEIWVQPIILEEMNHVMTNAMFVSPEGYGSVSATESGTYYQNKDITIKTDEPIEVSLIHLSDNFGENVTVMSHRSGYSCCSR